MPLLEPRVVSSNRHFRRHEVLHRGCPVRFRNAAHISAFTWSACPNHIPGHGLHCRCTEHSQRTVQKRCRHHVLPRKNGPGGLRLRRQDTAQVCLSGQTVSDVRPHKNYSVILTTARRQPKAKPTAALRTVSTPALAEPQSRPGGDAPDPLRARAGALAVRFASSSRLLPRCAWLLLFAPALRATRRRNARHFVSSVSSRGAAWCGTHAVGLRPPSSPAVPPPLRGCCRSLAACARGVCWRRFASPSSLRFLPGRFAPSRTLRVLTTRRSFCPQIPGHLMARNGVVMPAGWCRADGCFAALSRPAVVMAGCSLEGRSWCCPGSRRVTPPARMRPAT